MQRYALAAELVDHGEDTEVASVGELIGDEVHRPALGGGSGHW